MKNDILVFAFEGNISEEVLNLLDVQNKFLIRRVGKKCDVEDFLTYVKLNQPQKILGLGMYSGKDQSQIRLETIAKNKFRNSIIGEIEDFTLERIVENPNFKIANGLGNSWCNLVSYKIMDMKNSGEINSPYSFLHIPESMNSNTVAESIQSAISLSD